MNGIRLDDPKCFSKVRKALGKAKLSNRTAHFISSCQEETDVFLATAIAQLPDDKPLFNNPSEREQFVEQVQWETIVNLRGLEISGSLTMRPHASDRYQWTIEIVVAEIAGEVAEMFVTD